ncbi:unnamed protein product, partial [Tetraodon nigroviridis]
AMAGFKRGYDGKIAGLYDLDKTLGRGHFAVVKLARHVFTGEKVAVKVIDKTKLDTVATGHLFQEVRCMKLVQHPNIVRLYEVIDTQTKLYLILELGDGGDMFDYIMKHEEGLNEDLAKKYFAQIVHAISYCHRLHVVHRDLKPENVVFFEKQGLVKLTDFGFSNKFQPGKKLTTSCGSLAYSAPEILLGDEYDAPAVGPEKPSESERCCRCRLAVLLTAMEQGTMGPPWNSPPRREANDSETLTMIMDCKYTVPARVSGSCKERLQEQDAKGWNANTEKLPGAEDIWSLGVILFMLVCGQPPFQEANDSETLTMIMDCKYTVPARVSGSCKEPQSPARSAENLLNGHRPKGLMELGRRDESVTDAAGPMVLGDSAGSSSAAGSGSGTVRGSGTVHLGGAQAEDLPVQVILRRKPPSITNRLTSRKSAPVLNQIFEEEGESDDDFDLDEGLPPKLSRLKMNMGNLSSSAASSPGATQKRYHRRKSQGRGSSCSSSETSDDDSESHRRRLDKDSGFSYSWNRRDSSEGPPGSSGGNGGGSSAGQSKPPGGGGGGGGTSGPDAGSPPGADGNRGDEGGGGGSGGSGGGGGGGGGGGQDSPSSCCNNSSSSRPSLSAAPRPSRAASRSSELVESLKLMSLCLSSQLQLQQQQQQQQQQLQQRAGRGGRGRPDRFILPPHGLSGGSVKIQEKSSWRMCIGSAGSLDTITLPTGAAPQQHPRRSGLHGRPGSQGPALSRDAGCNLSALKSGVLQLPLYEKTISVNIQRGGGSRDGLLCSAAPASCCQVV